MNLDIILDEQARVPAVVDLGDRRVLIKIHRQPEQEIGQRVARPERVAAVEAEDAVVVERRVLDHLFERSLAAEFEVVVPTRPTEDIAHLIQVAASYRPADGDVEIETARDLN